MNHKPVSLEEKDKRYIWHPFTQMKEWLAETPLVIDKGAGSYIFDTKGRKYIDGSSSIWVNIHGHRKKEIDTAIQGQLKKIAHSTLLGLSNTASILLAEKLIGLAHNSGLHSMSKVFYSDNGSTAVEVGLKMAFSYWQLKGGRYKKKTKFLALENAYHGDTIGSVSLGGIDLFHKLYKPLLFETIRIPSPDCYRCKAGSAYPDCDLTCARETERIFRRHHKEIAAIIIEPIVQAAAGIIISPPGYLSLISSICKQYDILFIADEVATGFGRTGKMFACEHEGIHPDMMAIAKGITGGYLPLAATLVTDDIYNAFLGEYREFKTFFHGHSYTGNPLGCAAAIANIDIFEHDKVLEKVRMKGRLLEKLLAPLKDHPHIGDIRQKGLMAGIELVQDKSAKTPYPLEDKTGYRVCTRARDMGLILRPIGNVIVLMPPLSISSAALKKMASIIVHAIDSVTGSG
ncbi:MAG: adenosylmethionine--8-amino-7-oxononanoate transaminase [Nitrospirae bacterium]|nr:adenosylmethionine--8-amino-7-oxononanoate transaminase [Nitrospirota bacterium]